MTATFSNSPAPEARSRIAYLFLALAVVAGGLLWRSGLIPLSPTLSNHGGDALWALMVFVGFGFLFPRNPTWTNAVLAVGFSWAVEFSQIYHAPWIDSLRATIPGRLVLGTTFNAIDLAAYAAGITIGAGCEMIWRRRGGRDRSGFMV